MYLLRALTVAAVLLLAPAARAADFDPIESYVEQRVEGWRVLVHKDLKTDAQKATHDAVLKQLGVQLYNVTRVVPGEALAQVRKVPIWIEVAHPRHPCMCYHPSPDWLRQHQMNPAKAGAVEIANVKNFLSWTIAQPWMVLHELAHGYHHQVLGYDNAEVKACYDEAVAAKSYESVLRAGDRKEKAYALTNDREYFAEASEAYFGTNDFYPFVRTELKRHDLRGYDLMEKLWGVKKAGPARKP